MKLGDWGFDMGIHSKVYIGHVETINTNANINEKFTESKVVALKFDGFDKNKNIPKYRPLRKYSEYYKLLSVERLDGIVSDGMINRAIRNTGKEEVKVLKKGTYKGFYR